MPFELLVEELRLERDLSRTPLFQVMLVLQNAPAPPVELEGLTVRPLDVGEQLAPFDLVVMMAETKRGLLGEAVYSTDLFDGATIARLVGHFQALLGDAVANPGRRVSRLALLEEPERHQLRTGWNDTLSGYPRHLCIHHLFAAQSSRAPDAVAVVFGDHHVGYGQLERRANRVAHLLRRQGTGPAALVGIWADRSPEVIAGLLGILKSGAGYVPLDPGWPVERVRGILSSLDVPCIVVDHARSRSVYELQYDLPALADIVYLDVETPGLPPEPLDTAAVRQVFDHVAEQAVDRVSAGGFVSSFTGKPFADAEVDAYRDRVVGLAEPYLGPHKRVLEIGCGSGLITFALSPRVGAYVGLDPSEATQARNRERVAANGIANVRLVTAFAHEIDALDLEPFDLVIIASTVQFFPGPAYLEQTIGQTLQLLRPGGAMLIADVMDAGRKQEFRQSLEAFREQHRDDPGIRTRTRLGSELYVDERFFLDLQAGCEDISGVRVLHRGDGFENELRFRYDVLLTRGGAPPGGRDGGGPAGTRRRVWTNWHLDRCPDGGLAPLATPDDVAYVIHTSGSTGAPKGVVICHEAAVNLIDWVNRTFRVGPGDRVLFVTSLCFDLSVYDVFGMLAAGGTIQVPPEPDVRDGERLLRLLRDRPVTFWDSAPAAFQQLVPALSSSEPGGNVERLRLVFLSGDWIPVTLPDTIGAAFPNAGVISLGGATEATIWSNYYPVGEVDLSWPSIPYGRPIQNAQYYVLDSYLNLCPIGAPGDLYIGGTCLATGYANSPGLTASKFIPCPFGDRPGARLYRTGDMARFLPDGNIEFLGRSDLQVKVRGFRIELGEVEAALAQYPAVQDAVVLAREDGPGDRRLVAYVVPKEGRTVAVDEVRRFLQEKLPEYMVPSLFVTLGALPLTPNGKVDRRALPQPDRTRPDLAKEFVPPRTPVEEMLADVWAQVLGIERIGVHDSFFDLGGHSLLATQVVSRVCDTFRVDLVLRSFFEAPTVAGLAQTVAALQFEQADADDLGLLRMVKGFSDAEAEAEMARLMDRESKGVRT
jgi:amino acid adenylation domain-containing protein